MNKRQQYLPTPFPPPLPPRIQRPNERQKLDRYVWPPMRRARRRTIFFSNPWPESWLGVTIAPGAFKGVENFPKIISYNH